MTEKAPAGAAPVAYPDIMDFKANGNIGPDRLLLRRWPTKPVSASLLTPGVYGTPMDAAWIVQVGPATIARVESSTSVKTDYAAGDAVMFNHHCIEDVRGFGQLDDGREAYGILMAKDVLLIVPAANLSPASKMPKE